jgi:ABC-type lipoprotein export system ATPase subunit
LGILDSYDSGEYCCRHAHQNLSERRAAESPRLIGFIFQSFNLIGFKTAVENVELPLFYQACRAASAIRWPWSILRNSTCCPGPTTIQRDVGRSEAACGIARA